MEKRYRVRLTIEEREDWQKLVRRSTSCLLNTQRTNL